MTDTASAALLKLTELVRRWRDSATWEFHDMGNQQSGSTLDQCADELEAVLASLPAPAVNKGCGATDYPVWGDGSHDAVTCARPAGHEGPHTGLIGAHQWTW